MNSLIASMGTRAIIDPAHCCRSLYYWKSSFSEHQGANGSFDASFVGLVPGFTTVGSC